MHEPAMQACAWRQWQRVSFDIRFATHLSGVRSIERVHRCPEAYIGHTIPLFKKLPLGDNTAPSFTSGNKSGYACSRGKAAPIPFLGFADVAQGYLALNHPR